VLQAVHERGTPEVVSAIAADVSCRLLEVDFSGIEAVLTGRCLWAHGFASDSPDSEAKQYIRLARLGMHAAVTALAVGTPIDLRADDAIVKEQLNAVKKKYPAEYDTSKRTVHANNFGMTVYGMVEKFPEFFPTIAAASKFQSFYHSLCPPLPKWHIGLRRQARETGKLGGLTLQGVPSRWDHPYGYQHWFWDVLNYRPCNEFTARKWLRDPERAWRIVQLHGRWYKMDPGGDANRVIAFYPQSTAAGRLKEVQRHLFVPGAGEEAGYGNTYIGDAYFGRTPLLGPIHDSLLLHLPVRVFDRVLEMVLRVMQTPSTYLPIPEAWGWGPYLPIGVSAKAGKNWAERVTEDDQIKIQIKHGVTVPLNDSGMEEIKVPAWTWVPTAGPDDPVMPREGEGGEDAQEDWDMLKRAVA
jgi:hypothetical protein